MCVPVQVRPRGQRVFIIVAAVVIQRRAAIWQICLHIKIPAARTSVDLLQVEAFAPARLLCLTHSAVEAGGRALAGQQVLAPLRVEPALWQVFAG